MIQRLSVRTSARTQFVDITHEVQAAVNSSGVSNGLCTVYVPHTTAGITINENADPDVTRDIIDTLERLVPRGAGYRHTEGNADSHVKASIMGFSVNVFVENGRLVLGTWQGIYFCEFDGPRSRQVYVRVA
ncbi:MAG TPA: secondary thiamine-phosphate synthase enzyme YjbQ, partial [Armatimonadota bacterium]|nr:secondary thiamine-phosphate synthase enzyme YjbQ [Armatimonadota bacterium]